MGRRAAPPRKAVGAAALGPPRLGAARHPSPAVHTKGPRDPASCSRRRAGPGLWARLQSLPPGRVSGPRLPRASSGLWGGGRGRVTRRLTGRRPLPAPPPSTPPPAPARTRLPPPEPPLTPPSAPARPPGRLRHAKAMANGRLLRLTAAPAPLLAEGKGAGAVRRRRPLRAKPPLFFLTHPPPPPNTHPEGFP